VLSQTCADSRRASIVQQLELVAEVAAQCERTVEAPTDANHRDAIGDLHDRFGEADVEKRPAIAVPFEQGDALRGRRGQQAGV
jgi:hypothetical protein